MTDTVKTPNVVKSVEEAKAKLKKIKTEKIKANTQKAKNKRGY